MSLGLNKHSNMFVKKFQNKQSTTSNESKEDDKKIGLCCLNPQRKNF